MDAQENMRVGFLTQCLIVVTHLASIANQKLILACQKRLQDAGMLATYGPGCAGLDRKYRLSGWMRLFGFDTGSGDKPARAEPVRGYGVSSIVH